MDDANVASGDSQGLREEVDKSGVRGALYWGCMHLDLDRIPMAADNSRARGPRLQVDAQAQG